MEEWGLHTRSRYRLQHTVIVDHSNNHSEVLAQTAQKSWTWTSSHTKAEVVDLKTNATVT